MDMKIIEGQFTNLTMGSLDIVVVIPELPMRKQSNEMIYSPVTKPNQAKYCLFISFFVMPLQQRGLRPKDRHLNGRAATTFRLPS